MQCAYLNVYECNLFASVVPDQFFGERKWHSDRKTYMTRKHLNLNSLKEEKRKKPHTIHINPFSFDIYIFDVLANEKNLHVLFWFRLNY